MKRSLTAIVLAALFCSHSHAEDRPALTVRALAPDGSPAGGAVVETWLVPAPSEETWGISPREPALVASSVADADGRATFSAEKSAPWRITIRADGRANARRTVQVDPAKQRTETIRLAPGFAFDGVISYGDGAYADGATVYAGPVGWEGDLASFTAKATTNTHGRFRLEGLPKGPADVWTRAPGGPLTWWTRVEIPGVPGLDLRLPRGEGPAARDAVPVAIVPAELDAAEPTVKVLVVTPNLEPIAGVVVTIGEPPGDDQGGLHMWPRRAAPVSETTGSDGRVELPQGRFSELSFTARAPGFATVRVTFERTGDRGAVDAVTLCMERGRDVLVRALDAEAKPIPGAWIRIGPDVEPEIPGISALRERDQRSAVWAGRTGADGTFLLRDASPAPFRVVAASRGRHPETARVAADAKEVVVSPRPHLSLSGALSWEDGRPAAGVVFSVVWIDGPPGWPVRQGPFETPADGRFEIGGLRAGRYAVEVETTADPAVAPAFAGPFEAGARDIALRVSAGRTVRGRVLSSARTPVAEASVFAAPHGAHSMSRVEARTGADGTFVLERAPTAAIDITVHARLDDGRQERLFRVRGVEPPAEGFELVLGDGLSITGRLVDFEGKPVAGKYLAAIAADDPGANYWSPHNRSITDEEGRFRIAGLEPGLYHVWHDPATRPRSFHGSGPAQPAPRPIDTGTGIRAGTGDVTLVVR